MLHLPFFFFIQKKGIPLPVTPKKPWSMDANLMHIRLVNIVRLKLTEINSYYIIIMYRMHTWRLIIILLYKYKLD